MSFGDVMPRYCIIHLPLVNSKPRTTYQFELEEPIKEFTDELYNELREVFEIHTERGDQLMLLMLDDRWPVLVLESASG